MTRILMSSVLAAAVALSCSGLSLAQAAPDAGATNQTQTRQRGPRAERGATADPGQRGVEEMTKELDLTADQQAKIKTILDDAAQAQRDAMQQMRQDRQGGDRAAMRTDMQKMMQQRRAAMEDTQTKINAVLTPEQQQKWVGIQLTRAVDARLRPLDLTADQKTKLDGIIKDGQQAIAAATTADARDAARGQVVKKIMSDVLTDKQAGELMMAGPGGPGGPMMGPPGERGPRGERGQRGGRGADAPPQ